VFGYINTRYDDLHVYDGCRLLMQILHSQCYRQR